ncbi:hypothetical protein E9993_15285 [Labilibacter sediminis]|nr:hypothetical protein E9993_15285 [Labilibacter sediminis]
MKVFNIISVLTIAIILVLGCNCHNGKWKGECSDAHDIGTIEIEQVEYNALKVYLRIETEPHMDAYIQYWEAQDSSKIYYSPLSQDNRIHEIMLVQLTPATQYKFNIVVQNSCCKTFSKTYDFKTKNPTWVSYYKNTRGFSSKIFDGNFHFHSRNNPGHMLIVDNNGNLNWYQKAPYNFKVSQYTSKNTFLGIISDDTLKYSSGKEIVEVDLYGQLVRNIKSGDEVIGNKIFHHEINYDKDGNLMVLTLEDREFDLSSIGGSKKDTVTGDGILILNTEGKKIWEWTVFDVLNPIEYKNILKEKHDWLHANSLFQDSVGNYLVSFRNLNQIWKINGKSGQIEWKLGGSDSDFNLNEDCKFYGQHHIRLDQQNDLVLLDNGNKFIKKGMKNKKLKQPFKLKNFKQLSREEKKKHFEKRNSQLNLNNSYSRLLKLRINEENQTVGLVQEVKFPIEYYTKSQGSAEFINDSIVMFCSTNNKRILFTDYEGNIKEVVPLEFGSYRAQYIPELYSTEYVK